MRQVQHKKEAYWFYRFLSIFYDDFVNPFFWTERMREAALELANLNRPDLRVVDVGSGTGFTTEGIVSYLDASHVTCIDQSPHQMAKARRKPALLNCDFRQGDAEDLPLPTDAFDRYISAGSIEYWPEPQRGITEAYRVLKPGGVALMIGPLRPENVVARTLADTWMLFPTESEYVQWFEAAGFTNLVKRYVAPSWVTREKYGIALAGTKPAAGESPLQLEPRLAERVDAPATLSRSVQMATRLTIGTLAGGLFIPLALVAYGLQAVRRLLGFADDDEPALDPLTPQQKAFLGLTGGLALLWLLRRKQR